MEKKYLSVYGLVYIENTEKTIVLRTNNRRITEDSADEIMQDYVDEHRDEFAGKNVKNVMQYAINRFKADVV